MISGESLPTDSFSRGHRCSHIHGSDLGRPGSFTGNTYISNVSVPTNHNAFDVKVDQKIGDKDTMFVRYSLHEPKFLTERGALPNPLAPGSFSANVTARAQQAAVSWTHLFGATMYNETVWKRRQHSEGSVCFADHRSLWAGAL